MVTLDVAIIVILVVVVVPITTTIVIAIIIASVCPINAFVSILVVNTNLVVFSPSLLLLPFAFIIAVTKNYAYCYPNHADPGTVYLSP